MSLFQRKIMSYGCLLLTLICSLLIVVATPCLCCKINRKIIVNEDSGIALLVLVPFFIGVICLLTWKIVKVFTKEDALRQIEQQFRNGVIDVETYKNTYKNIEMFEMEKKKLKYQVEMEKQLMKEDIKRKVNEIRQQTKENN